ncbi:PD40 domain-containing protein [bacterium]|nr:PD40 domain-containing protein [bacterium]
MTFKHAYITTLILLSFVGSIFCESFGRNKVQYDTGEWYYFEEQHFTLYFENGFENLAIIAADILEEAYDIISDDLGHGVEKPVPVILYASPGDFQQTNITMSILGEGTGGFTESFKTRVVLPFNGSYEDFRHVLIHEMAHGIVFDKLLGRGPVNQLAANRIFEMPLWLAEGISEWESICWDVESDMYLRDAILNDYVVPLNYLSGFLAYKEGASVVNYIARRYGRRKVGEILGKGQVHITADAALKSAIGKDQKKLYEDWLETKKTEYFPEYGFRKRPKDIASRVTDHEKEHSYYNVMPAFSPDGHTVAFLSDKDDYVGLYTIDIITEERHKIASSQRKGSSESFHPFRSRPGWSSDGNYLAFSRKHGDNDELVIYSSEDWKIIKTLSWQDFREISSPVFIPGDSAIAFSALVSDRSDIFIAKFDGSTPLAITADKYDDRMPSISPDGKRIAFSSDRPIEKSIESLKEEQGQMSSQPKPEEFPYGAYNIWIYNLDDASFMALTTDGFGNDHPAYSPNGEFIAYTSERNGIRNLWMAELGDSVVHRPYSDLLSGAFSPSWDTDSRRIVFSAYFDGGFDVYYLEHPIALDSLVNTPFISGRDSICACNIDDEPSSPLPIFNGDLRRYEFTGLDYEEQSKDSLSREVQGYTPQFSLDLISGVVGYDTYYGFVGQTYLSFSDLLGNQRITFIVDLLDDIENSTIYANYSYLARRTDLGATLFHYRDYFWDNNDRIFSDRVIGGGFYAHYPLSQFDRLECSIEGIQVIRNFIGVPQGEELPENEKPFDIKLSLGAVRDNSLWGNTGPLTGSRMKVSFELMPGIDNSAMDYYAGRMDLRKYTHFGQGYSFAIRLATGAARGERTPRYWLGGTESWLNWRTTNNDIYSVRDIYYSRMLLPLRGFNYFAYSGQTYLLANLELRYPFIQYLKLGMPPITIGGINGVFFTDIGTITGTDLSEFRGWRDSHFEDIKIGMGFGARAWIWWLLFNYDIAWQYDLSEFSAKPYHHISLGGEF